MCMYMCIYTYGVWYSFSYQRNIFVSKTNKYHTSSNSSMLDLYTCTHIVFIYTHTYYCMYVGGGGAGSTANAVRVGKADARA